MWVDLFPMDMPLPRLQVNDGYTIGYSNKGYIGNIGLEVPWNSNTCPVNHYTTFFCWCCCGLLWVLFFRWTYLQENRRLGSFVWSFGTQMRSLISIFCNKQTANDLDLFHNVTGGSWRWLLFQRGKDERHLRQRLAESTEELANDWSQLSNIDAATSYFFTSLDLDFRALRTARQLMFTTGPWQGRATSTGGF